MPSRSPKQKRTMAAECKKPGSTGTGIPRKVACEYHRADKKKAKRRRTR